MKISPREKGETWYWLSPPRFAFLAWSDFHARSHFALSTIPEEKMGTARSLALSKIRHLKT